MKTVPQWGIILLAGGQSRRMGSSKSLLDVGGKRLIEHMADISRELADGTVVVSSSADRPLLERLLAGRAETIADHPQFAGMGPLAGMHAGMRSIGAQWYIVLSNDLPNLDRHYLAELKRYVLATDAGRHYDAFVPIESGRNQPFAAAYRNQAQRIEALLAKGMHSWKALCEQMEVCPIEEAVWRKWSRADRPFFNMNTAQDYAEWRRDEHGGISSSDTCR